MAVEAEDLAARLKAEFPHALSSGQLVAYYQPEIELSSGRVVAAESLARWEHPEFGTLPPALFTPVAAQLGLMGELTRLMLRLSLVQHRVWAAAGLRIFATGMLVFIAADVTYVTIHAPYHGGDPVDTLWMLALTILWVAAACQLRV